jgi:NAD(P)-dependent dehydrogenase (short-subunit alcohol dehydrogenase family)
MRVAGEGWIVNLSSGSARPWSGPPYEPGALGSTATIYGASKAALNRLTNGLGAELRGTGIGVFGRFAVVDRRSGDLNWAAAN